MVTQNDIEIYLDDSGYPFEKVDENLCLISRSRPFSKVDIIAVTGPNRESALKTDLPCYFAVPGGDMMMTGPIGLIEATKRKGLFIPIRLHRVR